MAFTSTQLEQAWANLLNSLNETMWVEIVSSTTGEFYRLLLTNGGLRHWNRATGAWDVTSPVPSSLIAVNVKYL